MLRRTKLAIKGKARFRLRQRREQFADGRECSASRQAELQPHFMVLHLDLGWVILIFKAL